MIAFASSLDQAGPLTRDVTDAALLYSHMTGRDPRDSTSLAASRADRACRPRERLDGITLGVPDDADRRGRRARRLRALRGDAEAGRGAGRDDRDGRAAAHRVRHQRLLRASRRPRRPRTSRASTASATACASRPTTLLEMYTKTRHDGFGDEVKRRIMLGTYALSSGYYDAYYGKAQRVRTKIAEDYNERLRRRRPDRHADRAERRVGAGRQERRPAGHVPGGPVHRADLARGPARDLDPQRVERQPARRLPDRRPGVQREPHPRRGLRAGAGDRLRRERAGGRHERGRVRDRHRPGDPRPAGDRRRRCSAAAR